jgi:hypothetical protein
VGKIVLASETRNVKLKNGDGLLLRVMLPATTTSEKQNR